MLRSEVGEVVDSREFTVNLNTGAVIDWSVVTLGSHWSVLLILSSDWSGM